MLAARFVRKSLFEVGEVADPQCPPGGLLVRVHACAICGTDLKVLQCQDVKLDKGRVTRMDIPRITGHELSGVVEGVGEGIRGFQSGDRIVVAPTVPCLGCVMCRRGYPEMCDAVQIVGYHRDGGFAQLIRVDQDVLAAGCVVKVPENVPLEAAALTEPLSCAVNCLELSPVRKGAGVLVMGAGPLGVIIADLAHHLGAGRTILCDISKAQLEKAAAVSTAEVTINLSDDDLEERVSELTDGFGVDLVITACSSPQAQQEALKVVGKRGAVNFFGGLLRGRSVVPLDSNLIHYKEAAVVGTHGSAPRHVAKAMELQAEGAMDLSRYVDRKFPLTQINEAVKVTQGEGRLKVLITPNG